MLAARAMRTHLQQRDGQEDEKKDCSSRVDTKPADSDGDSTTDRGKYGRSFTLCLFTQNPRSPGHIYCSPHHKCLPLKPWRQKPFWIQTVIGTHEFTSAAVAVAILCRGKMHSAHHVKSLIVKCRLQGQDYTHIGVQLSLLSTSIEDLFMVPN